MDAVYRGGLVCSFHDWPGGGGNLNYPLVYQQGLASVIKDVEERMNDMEMRLPSVSDETRLVVSEPLVDLPGAWNEVPESSCGIIQSGADDLRPFRPRR